MVKGYSMKGFILSKQISMFGKSDVVGFGSSDFHIKEIGRDLANKIIKDKHYSHKFCSNSTIQIGVFSNEVMIGVLQYGCAMNPASGPSVVATTKIDEFLELNRMRIKDVDLRNAESMAVSYSIKYIKRKYPKIKWIQSFADQRCGKFGIVYQACSFSYYGEHKSIFWEIDGVFYHNSIMTNGKRKKKKFMQENKSRAVKHTFRQFRYIKFVDKRYKKLCKLKEMPYPKHYLENAAD